MFKFEYQYVFFSVTSNSCSSMLDPSPHCNWHVDCMAPLKLFHRGKLWRQPAQKAYENVSCKLAIAFSIKAEYSDNIKSLGCRSFCVLDPELTEWCLAYSLTWGISSLFKHDGYYIRTCNFLLMLNCGWNFGKTFVRSYFRLWIHLMCGLWSRRKSWHR